MKIHSPTGCRPPEKTMDDQHRGSTADIGHQLHLGPWDPSRPGAGGPFETEGCYPAKMGFTSLPWILPTQNKGYPAYPLLIYLICYMAGKKN